MFCNVGKNQSQEYHKSEQDLLGCLGWTKNLQERPLRQLQVRSQGHLQPIPATVELVTKYPTLSLFSSSTKNL